MQNLLTKGNAKLDKSVLGWSLTPVLSCLNCSECKKDCYAIKSYRQYPNVKIAWDRNLGLARSGEFVDYVVGQLLRVKKEVVVRIHVSGDFFSQDYINNWVTIAKTFPNIKFYSYTKVMHLLDFSELVALDNVNIVNSVASDGHKNFGDQERIDALVKLGYTVCPATVKKGVICGGKKENSCTICQDNDKVCFFIH